MNSFFRQTYYLIVKTRLHVAAIYYFVCANILDVFTKNEHKLYIPVIISFTIWHYALYLFDRAYDANLDYLNNPMESLKGRLAKPLLYLSILLAFLPVGILSYYKLPVIPYLFFIPITFFYNLRVFPGNKAIKHFTLFKNLYSAILIWPLPVAVMIKYYVGYENHLLIILLWFWAFILYVLMGEIIWDMRDTEGDKKENIRTIPVVFGLQKTRLLLLGLLTTTSILQYIQIGEINYVLISFYLLYIFISSPRLPKWVFHAPLFISLFTQIHKYF